MDVKKSPDVNRIVFRAATASDIETVRALAVEIWQDAYKEILGRDQIAYMLAAMYDASVIRDELSRGVVWELAFSEKTHGRTGPIAFLSFEHLSLEKTLKLRKLYLRASHHGRGIGRCMLDHVLERAADLGAERVRLQVNKQNEQAIRAYRRAGFVIDAEVVVDIGGGFVMDDYMMSRSVDAPPGRLR